MIQELFLSPVVIFFAFAILLIVVSRWAFAGDMRDRLSYALGWMIGALFILIHQATTPVSDVQPVTVEETVTLAELILPALFGFFLGTAGVILIGVLTSQSTMQRRAIIAALTAVLVFVLYLVAVGSQNTAQTLGVGVLTFGIGVMSVYIFAPIPQTHTPIERARNQYEDANYQPTPERRTGEIPSADPERARDRFDEIRRRYDDER